MKLLRCKTRWTHVFGQWRSSIDHRLWEQAEGVTPQERMCSLCGERQVRWVEKESG